MTDRHAGTATPASDEATGRRAGGAVRMASGANLLLGLWLVIAPWVLDYSSETNAVWNQVVVGIAIATLALLRTMDPAAAASLSWTNFVLGGWLLFAPFVLRYDGSGNTSAIYWNDILVGVLVIGLAAWSATASDDRTGVAR